MRPATLSNPKLITFNLPELDRDNMRQAMRELRMRTEAEFIRAAILAHVEYARKCYRERIVREAKELREHNAALALARARVLDDHVPHVTIVDPTTVARDHYATMFGTSVVTPYSAPVDPVDEAEAYANMVTEQVSSAQPPPQGPDLDAVEALRHAEESAYEREQLIALNLPWLDEQGNEKDEGV